MSGGRPKAFKMPTSRINLMLPTTIVQEIRQQALDHKMTPGQVLMWHLHSLIVRAKEQL